MYDDDWEAQERLNRRMLDERFGENGWWTRQPPPPPPAEEQFIDTPLLQARRRRDLEREACRHDRSEQGVADAGA